MGSMSLQKGKRAEREVAKIIQSVVDSLPEEKRTKIQRNTLQYDSGGFDIVGIDWLAVEVKHQETLQVEKWWKQTCNQAIGRVPVLFYKQNRSPWRVLAFVRLCYTILRVEVTVEDWMRLLRQDMLTEYREMRALVTLEDYSNYLLRS